MKHLELTATILTSCALRGFSAPPSLDVRDLLRRSVVATARNWKEAPNYTFIEHDIEEKIDAKGKPKSRIDKTYEVSMMDGSQYNKLLKVNGKPLSPDQQ